jgi:UDP-glucose 4-epimerase
MTVLVTGGAGFIGTHTCVDLLRRGHDVVIADNFSNSSPAAIDAVRRLSGADLVGYEADLRDAAALDKVFATYRIDAVIHFAAMKSVRESTQVPLTYYDNNLGSTIGLAAAMARHGVRKLVFSGSCSIYGAAYREPIAEDFATGPTNPYASTKLMCEQILRDACTRWPELSVVSLRYFNPIGGHPSGELGEDPKGVPSNVLPFMMQVAVGRLPRLQVYGGDWETPDGSGVRDYIHVLDVAGAHCVALEHLDDEPGFRAFNLGTGTGVSVLELIAAFQRASGLRVPYEIIGRQPGDVAILISDPGLIDKTWGWRTSRDLDAMCADAWRFQSLHPHGYAAP